MSEGSGEIRWRFPLYVFAAFGLLLFQGCASRKQAAPAPPAEYHALVSEGDAYFAKSHLWGWRKALASYKSARTLFKDDGLSSKLILTAALVATREHDEGIRDEGIESEMAAWVRPGNARDQFLLSLTSRYRKSGLASAGALPSEADIESLLDYRHDPLDAYLYVQYLKASDSPNLKEADATLSELYKESTLFLYRGTVEDAEKARSAHPEFAELTFFLGEVSFSNQIIGKAREYLTRTVELLPDHISAINGLGDVQFFGLQDYAKAMEFYERARAIDGRNVKAAFGKAASLHYLGKFTESNLTMDSLLNGKDADWSALTEAQADYFRGEGYYYTAYNYHLLDNPTEARRRIETAKSYLPKSGGINFLSGLMYYKAGRTVEAEVDFTKVLSEGSTYCEAPYYLGLIDNAKGGSAAPGYFLSAAECLTKSLKKMEDGLQAIPRMDVTVEEKAMLTEKAQNGLRDFRKSSAEMLDRMIRLTEPGGPDEQQTSTRTILQAVLAEVGGGSQKSAHTLN